MKKRLILEEDLRYIAFAGLYKRFGEPKTQRRALEILEGSIRCFDKKGLEKASLGLIAKECKVTRPLLAHYFRDFDEIRELSFKYIRFILQSLVVDAISSPGTEIERLRKYLAAHFQWCEEYRSHARVWLQLLASTARNSSDRSLNATAVNAGTNRLIQFLSSGQAAGIMNHRDDWAAARQIQVILLGGLVSQITEEIESSGEFVDMVVNQCLNTVRIRAEKRDG